MRVGFLLVAVVLAVGSLGESSPAASGRAAGQLHLASPALDQMVQLMAERALDAGLEGTQQLLDSTQTPGEVGGSVVVLDLFRRRVAAVASGPERNMSRALVATPPGSTVKPFVALAALSAGLLQPGERLACPAAFRFEGRSYDNWRAKGEGSIDVARALEDSCNTFFFQLAAREWTRGPRTPVIESAYARIGFGQVSGLIPGEQSGNAPDRALDPGEVLSLAVGQDGLRITPFQLARAYASLADPSVTSLRGLDGSQTALGGGLWLPAYRADVIRGLELVSQSGTAAAAFRGFPLGRIPVAAKTGSAEELRSLPSAWFACFAPARRPRWVIVVDIDNGLYGGRAAAPIARALLDDLLQLEAHGRGLRRTLPMLLVFLLPLLIVMPSRPVSSIAIVMAMAGAAGLSIGSVGVAVAAGVVESFALLKFRRGNRKLANLALPVGLGLLSAAFFSALLHAPVGLKPLAMEAGAAWVTYIGLSMMAPGWTHAWPSSAARGRGAGIR